MYPQDERSIRSGGSYLTAMVSNRYNGYMNKCTNCQKETSNPKFCSLSCGAKYQFANQPKFSKVAWCDECQSSFKYMAGKRFCSKSCSAKFNNKRRTRDIKAKEKFFCDCGTKVSKSSFQCQPCDAKKKRLLRIQSWIENSWDGSSAQGLSTSIKKYLIEQAGFKCTLCGWNEINPVTGRSPLEVDHIDGDCYNNRPGNLRVICPNCHSLMPTYRALNKNGKRKYRSK